MTPITRSNVRRIPTITIAVLVLTLFLLACDASPTDRSGNFISADEVLAAAREAVGAVTSYRSKQRIVGDRQADGRNIATGTLELIWSAPDNIDFRSEGIEEGGEQEEFRLISTDGRVFARQSTTGNVWEEYDKHANPENREARGILSVVRRFSAAPELIPAMDQAELVGTTIIDGLSVYQVEGTISVIQEIPDGVPADVLKDWPRQQTDSTYQLYVSTSDFLPRRLLTETSMKWETPSGDTSETEPIHMELTDDFLDYNVPVTIELPEAG